MRTFINLFLIFFAADGLISLVDELLVLMAGASNLSGVRDIFASTVILLSLPLYLALGIDRRPPRKVFAPLLVFLVWTQLATWLFPALAESNVYSVVCALVQVLLCILPAEYARRNGGKGLLMPQSVFTGPFFNLRHTLYFTAASLFIVPVVFLLCVFASANAYTEHSTAGFIRIAPDGLYMSERTYRLDNKTIRLTGMIHVGDQKFYDDMSGTSSVGRTIILAEGVTDDKHLLTNRFGYSKMAGFLGLSSQEKMRLKGRLIENADDVNSSRDKAGTAESDIVRADLDVSDFNKETVYFLNTIGKLINENSSFAATLMAINTWAEKELTPEMNRVIMADILHKRSNAVLTHLDKALAHYETIIIPWGALHMSEIEDAVLKRGFVLSEKKARVSIDFKKMFLAMIGFGSGDKAMKKP